MSDRTLNPPTSDESHVTTLEATCDMHFVTDQLLNLEVLDPGFTTLTMTPVETPIAPESESIHEYEASVTEREKNVAKGEEDLLESLRDTMESLRDTVDVLMTQQAIELRHKNDEIHHLRTVISEHDTQGMSLVSRERELEAWEDRLTANERELAVREARYRVIELLLRDEAARLRKLDADMEQAKATWAPDAAEKIKEFAKTCGVHIKWVSERSSVAEFLEEIRRELS